MAVTEVATLPGMMDVAWSLGQLGIRWLNTRGQGSPGAAPPRVDPPPPFAPPPFAAAPFARMPDPPTPPDPPRIVIEPPKALPAPSAPPSSTPMAVDAPGAAETQSPPVDRQSPIPASEISLATGYEGGISYSRDVAQGIACAACTKDHLATMAGAAKALTHAQAAGDEAAVRYHLARIAAEAAALERYDWTPEKIAATPPDKLRPVEAVQPAVRDLAAQLPTPPDLALAWGALDECIRFAEGRPTDRDRQEIATRLADVDEKMNTTERVTLSPEWAGELDPATVDQARQAIRAARHALEQGDPFDLATLKPASAQLSRAAVAMTPPLDAEQARQLAARITATQQRFYATYFGLERSA